MRGNRQQRESQGRSWMLIQILFKDYRRLAEVQLEDLSRCLSAPVTMPTALGNY